MRQLDTIQTKEKLNNVYAVDKPGNGGANHEYLVKTCDDVNISYINFQDGPRLEDNIKGVLDTDLLEICRDRMKSFQAGPYSSEYNEKALYHIEEALKALNERVEDRISRGVLGKNER